MEALSNLISSNKDFFILLLIIAITRLRYLTSGNMIGVWIANFVGTFFHELAHLLISLLMFGKPTKVSLLPSKTEKGYQLGYVESSNIRWYNALPISLAPLLLLVLAFYFNKLFFVYVDENIYTYIAYLFIIITLIENAIPSGQDFKVAFSNIGFIVYIAAAAAYLYYVEKGFYL